RRPNAIGLSIVRLLCREGCVLRVAGVDMVDGTPLLDIKPYVPRFDCRPEASSGWMKANPPRPGGAMADGRFGV
ncbi:MAG TPA: TrmO family methyltransferase, partial [Phycisphaerae bacterium]|nr:TrmO family methyltransferase [Phycisphaerae bacterium]